MKVLFTTRIIVIGGKFITCGNDNQFKIWKQYTRKIKSNKLKGDKSKEDKI